MPSESLRDLNEVYVLLASRISLRQLQADLRHAARRRRSKDLALVIDDVQGIVRLGPRRDLIPLLAITVPNLNGLTRPAGELCPGAKFPFWLVHRDREDKVSCAAISFDGLDGDDVLSEFLREVERVRNSSRLVPPEIQNRGQEIISTSYYSGEQSKAGLHHLSYCEGAFRLLVPEGCVADLSRTAARPAEVIIVKGYSIDLETMAFAVTWLDGTATPYSVTVCSFDGTPARSLLLSSLLVYDSRLQIIQRHARVAYIETDMLPVRFDEIEPAIRRLLNAN